MTFMKVFASKNWIPACAGMTLCLDRSFVISAKAESSTISPFLDSCFHRNDELLFDSFMEISKILTDGSMGVNVLVFLVLRRQWEGGKMGLGSQRGLPNGSAVFPGRLSLVQESLKPFNCIVGLHQTIQINFFDGPEALVHIIVEAGECGLFR